MKYVLFSLGFGFGIAATLVGFKISYILDYVYIPAGLLIYVLGLQAVDALKKD